MSSVSKCNVRTRSTKY